MPHYIKTGYWALEKNGYKGWLNLEDIVGGGGGTGGAEDITFSQLYNNTVNGLLIPGKWYRLTDYRSVNFLNGWTIANQNPTPTDPNFNPRQIHVGDPEVLIIQAVSPYQISEIGYSETFQGDMVQYRPYVNKIAVNVDVYNGATLPDSSVVSGFDLQWDGTNVYFEMPVGYPMLYGQYLYLYCEFDSGNYYQDGYFDPVTPNITVCQFPSSYDDPDYGYLKAVSRIKIENGGYKIVLIDLTETDYNNYDLDTLYISASCQEIGDAYGLIVRRVDTFRVIDYPLDFRGRLYRRFEVDLSSINPSFSTPDYYGQGDNYKGQGTTGNYKDFKVFGSVESIQNVQCNYTGLSSNGAGDNSVFLFNFSNVEISGWFVDNTIGGIIDVTIGENFVNNTLASINNSTIGSAFQNNLIYVSNYNKIENGFNSNIAGDFIGNTISFNFISNVIGNPFNNNVIGVNFSNNTIGDSFSYNTIQSDFAQNTIGNNFKYNRIDDNFSNNTIGNNFLSNEIPSLFGYITTIDNFRYNTINYEIPFSTNFSTATHVYGDYNCQLFKRSDGSLQLSYVDGTNTVQYTTITA